MISTGSIGGVVARVRSLAEAAPGPGLGHPLIELVEMSAAWSINATTVVSRRPMVVVEQVLLLR